MTGLAVIYYRVDRCRLDRHVRGNVSGKAAHAACLFPLGLPRGRVARLPTSIQNVETAVHGIFFSLSLPLPSSSSFWAWLAKLKRTSHAARGDVSIRGDCSPKKSTSSLLCTVTPWKFAVNRDKLVCRVQQLCTPETAQDFIFLETPMPHLCTMSIL